MEEKTLNLEEKLSIRTSSFKRIMKISIWLFLIFATFNVILIYNFIKILETI